MSKQTIVSTPQSRLTTSRVYAGKRNPFNLIELVVVIAVIGLLAGITIPVFNNVRENAAYTQSTSNLRQLGSAMSLYMNDQGGYFPPSVNRSSTLFPHLAGVRWVHALDEYIDGYAGRVYSVPAFYSPLAPGVQDGVLGADFVAGVGLYGYNAGLDNPNNEHGLMHSSLERPSETIVFGEKRYDTNSGPHLASSGFWPDVANGLAKNYSQGAPVLYADWSVSAVTELPPVEAFHPGLAY